MRSAWVVVSMVGVAAALACGEGARIAGSAQTCTSCHGAPPGGAHPRVTAELRWCSACHSGTVDATGALVAGGLHRNGRVEATAGGHAAGYGDPAVHGRDFFQAVSAQGGPVCQACHGADYGSAIANGQSCNGCHAAAGWTAWQANCSFCHGVKSAATQAGYALADHPTWSAPPDAISQRLGGGPAPARTGAHALHLTGSAMAGPLACGACHLVPGTVAHIGGRDERAAVLVTAPGRSPDPIAYDRTTGTCATYCHGASPSPAWSSTGLQCNGCHGLPPATAAHGAVSSELAGCMGCHPDTMTAGGAVNVAGGRHLDGRVDVVGHPAGYANPALHARDFFEVALSAAPSCTGCHGASYDVPVAGGQSCNSCHAAAGWRTAGGTPNWQTNCSFCHGTRNATTQPGYDVTAQPALAAPPDAISERLGGGPAPERTGAHRRHLAGSGVAGPFPCATCHDPVPTAATALSHIQGRAVRSPVIVTAPGTATPDPAAYDQATGTCATYCHGSARSPAWSSSAGLACSGCHGQPPATAVHSGVSSSLTGCRACHPDTVNADGTIDVAGGQHVDGTKDTNAHPAGYASAAAHGRDFFQTAAATPPSCTVCHGAAYDAPIAAGQSCNGCHAAAGWRTAGGTPNWQTNCSFCHGRVDATTQRGYAVADQPAWSAPPDAISQRLDGVEAPARTGAHRGHLAAGSYAGAFACEVCHAVPAALDHIGGRNVRASVVVTAPGRAPDAAAYDPGTGRCGTSCHGASPSPTWSTPTIACNGCHGLPPATTAHATVGADVTRCTSCHADTVDAAGAILVAGGRHLNGAVDLTRHAPGYASVLAHGPQALDHLANAPGALACTGCHGAAYDTVMSSGRSCSSCHALSGWQTGGAPNWRTNCTFCHGTRVYQYTAADLLQASPPEGVAERLGGAADPATEGKHRSHLAGRTAGTWAFYAPTACSACHVVPADPSHVSSTRIAAVVFTPEGAFPALTQEQRDRLPNPLMTYSRATGCTGYCHGSTLQGGTRTSYAWSPGATVVQCGSCHGYPPASGKTTPAGTPNYCGTGLTECSVHRWHQNMQYARGMGECNACHLGQGHVNGLVDPPAFLSPNGSAGFVTGTWDPAQKSCSVSCHTNESQTRYWTTSP